VTYFNCHIISLSNASNSLSYSTTTTIAATLLPMPSVNDVPEEYGLIYKILLAIAGIIITVTMYLGGKNINFKFVCCNQLSNRVQGRETISNDSNTMDIIELYEQVN